MYRALFILGFGFTKESFSDEILSTSYKEVKFFDINSFFSKSHVPDFSGIKEQIQEDTTLIAWSLGTLLGIDLYEHVSDKINKIILISGTTNFKKYTSSSLSFLELEKKIKDNEIEPALKNFYYSLILEEKISRKESFTLLDKFLKASSCLNKEVLLNSLRYLEETNNFSKLDNIKCPIYLLHGERDKLILKKSSEDIKEKINSSIINIVSNTGHLLPITNSSIIKDILKIS